jgi:adenylate cyclase
MGTATRFNYTMMGDNVNLAARLESGAKSYGVWTLCSETTKAAAERTSPGEILFRSLGRIIVKVRAQPLELFEPLAFQSQASQNLLECVAVFEAGLSRWKEKDWAGAVSLFEKSARLERDRPDAAPDIKTNPSLVFLSMAQSYRDNPGTGPLVV